jgi:hypothetical protein
MGNGFNAKTPRRKVSKETILLKFRVECFASPRLCAFALTGIFTEIPVEIGLTKTQPAVLLWV